MSPYFVWLYLMIFSNSEAHFAFSILKSTARNYDDNEKKSSSIINYVCCTFRNQIVTLSLFEFIRSKSNWLFLLSKLSRFSIISFLSQYYSDSQEKCQLFSWKWRHFDTDLQSNYFGSKHHMAQEQDTLQNREKVYERGKKGICTHFQIQRIIKNQQQGSSI